ncbi:MAG: hypothetical protein AB4041_15680 [Microcystaceae cyanobacterium]
MYFSSNQIYLLKESKNYIKVLEYYLTTLDRHIQQPMVVDVIREQNRLEERISIFLKCKDTLFFLKEWQFSDVLGESILLLKEIKQLLKLKYAFMCIDIDVTIQLIREHINQVKGQIQTINSLIDERIEELKEDSNDYIKQIDQTIEITLKEHETLRNEILQNMSNRSQLILLGLAAIFTVAGLALTPLTGLLTTETTLIEPSANIIVMDNTQDKKKLYEINLSQSSEETKEEELKITRKTTEGTIKTAMIPVIIVLGWIIPLINTYIIYRVLNWTEQILTIGKYIKDNIEEKIDRLSRMKFRISSRLGLLSGQYNDIISHNLYWERYLSSRKKQEFRDYRGIILIIGLLITINITSFLAANILFISDYINDSTYNDFKIFFSTHPLVTRVVIFLITTTVLFMYCERFSFKTIESPSSQSVTVPTVEIRDFIFWLIFFILGLLLSVIFYSFKTSENSIINWIIATWDAPFGQVHEQIGWTTLLAVAAVILILALMLLIIVVFSFIFSEIEVCLRSYQTKLMNLIIYKIDDLTADDNIKNWIMIFALTILTTITSFAIDGIQKEWIDIFLEGIFVIIPFFVITIVSLIALARLWNIRKAYDRKSSISNPLTTSLDDIKDKNDYISEIARKHNGLINVRINDNVSIDVLTLTTIYQVITIDKCNTVAKIDAIRKDYMKPYQDTLPNHERIVFILGTKKYTENLDNGELPLQTDPPAADILCIENALKKDDKKWLKDNNLTTDTDTSTNCQQVKLDKVS